MEPRTPVEGLLSLALQPFDSGCEKRTLKFIHALRIEHFYLSAFKTIRLLGTDMLVVSVSRVRCCFSFLILGLEVLLAFGL